MGCRETARQRGSRGAAPIPPASYVAQPRRGPAWQRTEITPNSARQSWLNTAGGVRVASVPTRRRSSGKTGGQASAELARGLLAAGPGRARLGIRPPWRLGCVGPFSAAASRRGVQSVQADGALPSIGQESVPSIASEQWVRVRTGWVGSGLAGSGWAWPTI